MHFTVFLKSSFDVVHNNVYYYFVFKLIGNSEPEELVPVLLLFFFMFLIKLHKTDLVQALCLEIWMTF